MSYQLSEHTQKMINEREIKITWLENTLYHPDKSYKETDNTFHYIKQIKENNNKFLRVIINKDVNPQKIITVFFDRRLK